MTKKKSQLDPVMDELLANRQQMDVLQAQIQSLRDQVMAMKKPFSPSKASKNTQMSGKKRRRGKKRDTLKESLAGRTVIPEQAEEETQEDFYSTVSRGLRLRKGDNVSNIVVKLISFMEKTHEEKKLQFELSTDFAKEEHEKEKLFNQKFLKAIEELKGTSKDKKSNRKTRRKKSNKQVVKPSESPPLAIKTSGFKMFAPVAVATGITAVAGVSTAAAFTIQGETGMSADKAIQNVGQAVPNDPKPGVTSYGIVGMNSGGSVQTFVKENPQFKLTAKPASKEFDEQWKKAAQEQPKEMLQAQLKWYQVHVESQVRNDMQKMLPKQLANDESVAVYLADRRNQYGPVMEQQAVSYASKSNTPKEFIQRMTEFDLSHIDQAFPTYLSTNPLNKQGLVNRITNRQNYALGITTSEVKKEEPVNPKLEQSSVVNKDLKKLATKNTVIVNNTVNSTNLVTNKQNIMVQPQNTDIKPAHMEAQ